MVYEDSNKSNRKCQEYDILAMSFIPRQKWREVYKYDCGFMRGTIFAELDKPWYGKRGGNHR